MCSKAMLLMLFASLSTIACAETVVQCPPANGIALQVLGSGGPIADDGRASSAYLVWVDSRSRFLIDFGGGAFLRFGEAGANFADLDFIGLSHFHTDHSADFPALLKSGYFSARERELVVAGPDAGGPFPGLHTYLSSMLGAEQGAYRYLSGYLDGRGRFAKLTAKEVDRSSSGPVEVFVDEGTDTRVTALHVPHGIVPAVAFRVAAGDTSIVFSSDQNGSDKDFAEFADAASLLVMHMTISEGASGGATELHARPSRIGEIAQEANADRLILSHFMARSLRNFDENLQHVTDGFDGPVTAATDLACYVVNN